MTSETDTTTLIEKTFDYDDMNRLKVETKAMNGHIVKGEETTTTSEEAPDLLTDYNRSYTYDDYGNILSKVDANQTIEYTYDKNNRLIKEKTIKTNETIIKSFSYDPNGNMLSEKSQILTNEAETPGSSLSIKDEHFKIYEYNLLNQQVLIATKNGITKYTYNASGLRATKTTENKTVKFYYEGSKIIGEETNGTLTATYLYGQGLINRKDQATNEKHYYFFNVHGDVTVLTDDTGEVVTVYDYNAYGEFNQRGKDIDNPFTYFGQYYDKETGHYYLRARYYNPSTMRFTQEDTYTGKSNDPLSLNRYLYGLGNPVMFVDPSGHSNQLIFEKAFRDYFWNREEIRMLHGWFNKADIEEKNLIEENSAVDGLMYYKIIQDKVNDNGEYMYKDIIEVPNKYERALKEFISPKVQAYGISLTGGAFLGLSGSAGIAYDDKGRMRLIWTIEGSGNAPIDPSMLLEESKGGLSITGFYSESYDAINVDDIMGDIVNIYNIEAGHILTAGKSKGKSVPDDSGRQTTWTTVKFGSGTIINIGASGSRTYGIDINDILDE